ncbi:uncharacterized membrane protein (DUF485 family) [Flavobacterium gossypii]|uniref:Uncharacterized membrane protein (DUF485 family) n=1 Tax=Flavobacterium gossypii TaxID=1646119 RepID=A0ABR6DQ78_9FLAO|nr:uncharacterized membrane protein (DUF485 family) [Flavobacterium gossypii]
MNVSRNMANKDQKSLIERFLLILGILFFLMYFVLGIAIIFWQNMPIDMPQSYRVAFGLLLIVYSFFRFVRFFRKNQ